MKQFIYYIYDILIPRFITEDVALLENEKGYSIACSIDDVQDGEVFDAISTMSSLTWLGRSFFVKQVGPVRVFEVWKTASMRCNNCGKKWIIIVSNKRFDKSCPDCNSLQTKETK